MDPVTHIVLPLLILLAARQDPRVVVPLSFFAILPDLDSLVGIHRMTLHNIFVIGVAPLAFILWARFARPNLVYPGMVALFYLVSHALLDLSGIALLYPLYDGGFYFEPQLEFRTSPAVGFGLSVDYGIKDIEQTGEYTFVSTLGFAYLFLLILLVAVFRREAIDALRRGIGHLRAILLRKG